MKQQKLPSTSQDQRDLTWFHLILTMAFLITASFFFLTTVFFNSEQRMIYPRYLPDNEEIGGDYLIDYRFSYRFFIEKKSAYISDDPVVWYAGNPYPPMFTYFMGPVFWFGIPAQTGYAILAGTILIFFIVSVLLWPMIMEKWFRIRSGVLFVALTGITSYGMQFALERGQFDLIAICFGLFAVYLFWFFPKLRWLAYVFIILGFQYKIYPLYFALCMFEDFKKPLKGIVRILSLALSCFLSLFVMGKQGFFEFLRALTSQNSLVNNNAYSKDHGFVNGISYLLKVQHLANDNRTVLNLSVIVVLIGFLSLALLAWNYSRKSKKVNFYPPLILWCTLAAMVLFPASKDYKLVIIFGSAVLYLLWIEKCIQNNVIQNSVLFYGSFAVQMVCYCSVLYSFAYRPVILMNSFPMLYLWLLLIPVSEISIRSLPAIAEVSQEVA